MAASCNTFELYSDITEDELEECLTARRITYPAGANKDVLYGLYAVSFNPNLGQLTSNVAPAQYQPQYTQAPPQGQLTPTTIVQSPPSTTVINNGAGGYPGFGIGGLGFGFLAGTALGASLGYPRYGGGFRGGGSPVTVRNVIRNAPSAGNVRASSPIRATSPGRVGGFGGGGHGGRR